MKDLKLALLCALALAAGCENSRKASPQPSQGTATAPSPAAQPTSKNDTGIGGRVFVVERETESLAVYDLVKRTVLPKRISGFGNMRHATMTFSPDLRYGYVATRSGKLSRIDLETLAVEGEVQVSENSIDIAISQDGRFVATAEYVPGALTIMDSRTLEVTSRLSPKEVTGKDSRVTGVVDAPGNVFVCVLMEGNEIWVVDVSGDKARILRRAPTAQDEAYDAMITPDGRYYVVGHMGSEHVSVLDLSNPESTLREVSLRDPKVHTDRSTPVKLPHMASWAVAGDRIFVPLVGEDRIAVLDQRTWQLEQSIPLRGHPVYAVASPTKSSIWVSFSGEEDDAYIQVIDTRSLKVLRDIEVGARIYHLDFTPRGSHVLVSANKANALVLVNANTFEVEDRETLASPSGIFGVWRAFRIGL